MRNFGSYLKKALSVSLVLLLLCGILYPLALTGLGNLFFPEQAKGSMIEVNGKKVGSEIVGQKLKGAQYFQGRISAVNYNTYTAEEKEDGTYAGVASGSYNYGASNEDLEARVKADVEAFQQKYIEATGEPFKGEIPADLLTASGSGLDPHISPAAAKIQIPIVAANAKLAPEEVEKIVERNTEGKVFGIFGEDKVNVLKCNLEIAEKTGVLTEKES